MRNSEAQRYARWSAVAAGVLAALVAGVYLRNVWTARQAERKAPPPVPPSVEQRSNEFSYSKVDGQRTIYTVKASHTTEFKEGNRNLLEDVSITVYGKQGERNDTLRTRACDFISKTGKISCAGDVEINLQSAGTTHATENAIHVATSGVTFDQGSGEVRTDKPVTFHWPAGKGHAIGISYDSNNGTLRLERNVELNLSTSPEALSGASDMSPDRILLLTGDSLVFQREARTVLVQRNARATQTTHTIRAESLLAELDTAFRARRLVASGHPEVLDSDPKGPISLTADEITSTVKPDGSLESFIATGSVHGTRSNQAGVDRIDAGRLQLDLATRENLPRLLTASNGVTLVSAPASKAGEINIGSILESRRVQSDAIEIHFSKNSRPGQIQVESVNTLAPANAELRSVSMVNGKAVPQTTRMSGKQMNLRFDGQNQIEQLVGSGNVEVTRKVGDAPEQSTTSRELTAKFLNNSSNGSSHASEWSTIDQIGDVRFYDGQRSGSADRAHTDRAANSVTLMGSVRLTGAGIQTTAQTATFFQSSSTLRADGHVVTTELGTATNTATSAETNRVTNFAPEPAHVSASHLVVDTSRGHATYSGSGRLWQGPSEIEADTIELDNPSRVLVAKGSVRGIFLQEAWNPKSVEASLQIPGKSASRASTTTSNRTGTAHAEAQPGHVRGELLTYWEAESRARVEQNAEIDSQQDSIQAEQIDLFFSDSGAANATKQISRAVANGEVTVHQEDRRGTSNRAEYTASEGKFVLSGVNQPYIAQLATLRRAVN